MVKVTVLVQGFGRGGFFEVEKLQFRSHVVSEPGFCQTLKVSFEGEARIAYKRIARWRTDVAKYAGYRILAWAPWQDSEGCRVRKSAHVTFIDSGKPLDGRPVEPHTLLDSVVKVVNRDRKTLQVAQNVGEPQAHKLNVIFQSAAKDEFSLFRRNARRRTATRRLIGPF